jgi:hypothetical protein
MNCVDGYCCTSPCTGPDERCDWPGREGECFVFRPAPAPTLSLSALAAGLAALAAVAGWALRRRRAGR